MRLLEFQASTILMRDLVNALRRVFDMERVGGESRVYDVHGRKGIIFLLNNSMRGLGLIWSQGTTTVQSVAVWDKIDFDAQPDYIVDIPNDAFLDEIIEPLIKFIRHPRAGMVEGVVVESARNVTPEEFRTMAKTYFKGRASYLSIDDLKELSQHFDVHIPSAIRHDSSLRADANHWNLHDDNAANAARAIGAKVGIPDPNDPNYHTAVELAKVKNVKGMASENRIILLGRKPNGEVFEIPGLDEITAKIERMLHKELHSGSHVGNSMEDQYTQLEQKVRLVAGGESEFVKSLLITGMPSAGKTFRVMKTIKELGLKPGKDYAVIGGKTTVAATYQVLVEQVDGLAIFDDCDSVVADKDGKNMLKKALDTDPVREISYNAKGLFNTRTMAPEERKEFVSAMGRILRGEASKADIYLFDVARRIPQRKTRPLPTREEYLASLPDWHTPNEAELNLRTREGSANRVSALEMSEAQEWVTNNLPNLIDFQGRIIFISNMRADEWDSAILTRAFHQDMQFSDGEMFDYIATILQHIKAPRLTEDDKKEVLEYLKSLWEDGKITRPVNFRLVQQAFDLRLLNDWRGLVASMG